MSDIRKLIYLSANGVQTLTANGDIANLGGTSNPTFTVAGKGLLFDDGTSTASGGQGKIATTLQTIYNNSSDTHGNASITLSSGKDFVIYDDNNSSIFFSIQSTTGNVTITGDLNVQGNTTIKSITEIADHWTIQPSSASTISLSIEPNVGVTPLADLINVKIINNGSPVFRVTNTGTTILKTLQVNTNITVVGTINGIDIVALSNEVYDHLVSTSFPKHSASQIAVSQPISSAPNAINVQQALEALGSQLSNLSLGAVAAIGFEFIQSTAASTWIINHNHNTKRIQFTIYDPNDEWILPNRFQFIDNNQVKISFGSPMSGRAVLILF